MQADTHAEPLHQRILVPLGASVALVAAVLAAAAIALIATPSDDFAAAVTDGSAVAVLRAVLTLVVDAFLWIVGRF